MPDCGCSILLRPTHSLTLFIQQSMRCMRYVEGKRAVIIDHVGNYARHGMPDDDRTWSLEKKPKRTFKQEENEQAEKMRQCPECYFTFTYEGRNVCPHCGYVFPKQERELEEKSEAKLIKVEGFRLSYGDTPESCGSYEELLVYAAHHGYKRGWAYFQARRRGLIA